MWAFSHLYALSKPQDFTIKLVAPGAKSWTKNFKYRMFVLKGEKHLLKYQIIN